MILYEKVWPYIKTGDLIEWRTNSLVGALIRLRTGQKVNHTSIAIRFDVEREPRRHVMEANELIELNLLSDRLRHHNGTAYWRPLKARHDSKRAEIRHWALEQRGRPYDWDGFFGSLFGRVSYDARLFFCSEFACAALVHVDIIDKPYKAPWPGEFGQFNCYGREVKIK
jgi:hypothetical protein